MRIQKVFYEYENNEELMDHIYKMDTEGFEVLWHGYRENLLRKMVLTAEYRNLKFE